MNEAQRNELSSAQRALDRLVRCLWCRLKQVTLRDTGYGDKLLLVFLWRKTVIYTLQDVEFHKRKYLMPAYTARWCWALKLIGWDGFIYHEPVSRIDELRRLGVISL